MTTITLDVETDVSADRFIAALTDFSERRPEVFRNLDPRFYRVHSVGNTSAEVTEGSSFAGGVWERVHYDWSQPNTVVIQVLEGNTFGPGSVWLYRIEPTSDGAHIHFELRRSPNSLKGWLLAALLSVVGARAFRADLDATLARLRNATDLAATRA
jgi:hypothetical protein